MLLDGGKGEMRRQSCLTALLPTLTGEAGSGLPARPGHPRHGARGDPASLVRDSLTEPRSGVRETELVWPTSSTADTSRARSGRHGRIRGPGDHTGRADHVKAALASLFGWQLVPAQARSAAPGRTIIGPPGASRCTQSGPC